MVASVPTRAAVGERGITYGVFWRETEEVSYGPSLSGEHAADVCIIGGGYTGLWTAHYLKKAEPGLRIIVLESDYAGSGASGHGDGFMTPTIGHNLTSLLKAYGSDRAKLAYTVVGKSILEVQRFAAKHGIDAQIEPTGYLNVATNARQLRMLERDLDLIDRLGASSLPELLDARGIRARVDSPALLGGFEVGGAMVNPHRLVRGLSRVVRAQAVEIFERSPAVSVAKGPSGFRVRTPLGAVSAGRVVYATNAYQHQFPELQAMVRPMWSYAIVTEPLTPKQLASLRWPGREGFVEARNLIAFARLTAQNRLLVGGGPVPYHYGRDMADAHMRARRPQRYLTGLLGKYFPMLRELRVTHAYGGCIDMTPDLVPHVGRLRNGALYAHGYCGNGVAFTNTVGKVMRDLVLDRETTYTDLMFVGPQQRLYPAEPVAWLKARMHDVEMRVQDRLPALP
ncbi:NAD(P)/FAD-dependent oxidoreductase [Nocardia sp. NPDC051321]|uniref:NAD(P)/FAD-dependent oxidoreductase n=1 Tax=Nocardia sp. NPDC051321 TaxID=3364323 RepID=UPI003791E903